MKNPKAGAEPKQPRRSKGSPSQKPPLPEVTAPEYSAEWMEEIDSLYLSQALDELEKQPKKKA